MRRVSRELWEILGIWWLLIPGGVVAAIATIQLVEGIHHRSIWFWTTWVMTGFAIASFVRVIRVGKERDTARAELADEESRDAVAHRLERFIREYEQLWAEVPGEQEGVGPVVTENQERWIASIDHLSERVSGELRQSAPGFVAYWHTDPQSPRLYFQPFGSWAKQLVDLSIEQLRHIAQRLRQGHDEPEEAVLGPRG
jgi:hypothetical protein